MTSTLHKHARLGCISLFDRVTFEAKLDFYAVDEATT
jgi:hypothetical protein